MIDHTQISHQYFLFLNSKLRTHPHEHQFFQFPTFKKKGITFLLIENLRIHKTKSIPLLLTFGFQYKSGVYGIFSVRQFSLSMTTVTYTGCYFIKESSKNLQKLNSYTCLEISRTGKKKKEGNKTSTHLKMGQYILKMKTKIKKTCWQ